MGMPSEIVVKVKVPSARYADELLNCHCAVDLLGLELFPNFKEITESFAAYNAVRKFLWKPHYFPSDPAITCIVVGDGGTPRTAATFAFRTRWKCWSVDPHLNIAKFDGKIERLRMFKMRAEELGPIGPLGHTVLVAVHSHADLPAAVQLVHANRLAVVAIPCCIEQMLPTPPDVEYDDWGIWSPERTVRVWKDYPRSNQ